MSTSRPPAPPEPLTGMARPLQSQAASLLRATLEATGDGIVVLGPDGHILLRNEQFVRMWNVPPELMGADTGTIVRYLCDQLDDPEGFRRRLQDLLDSPDAEGFNRITFKDGRVFERYTSPVRLDDGTPARVLAYRDISLRVAAEREAHQAREAAEAANRAKSEFLDNVSHEMRTPLNGVLGLTRLLLAEPLTAQQRRYVELADTSAGALLALIDDLLDLGKIESGRMELQDAPFDLHELLRELEGVYRVRAQAKDLAFVVEVDPRVPRAVRGDGLRLRQVLHNLLSNALKFTEEGEFGLVVVPAEASRGPDLLRFTVFDTGIGIPFEVQHLVFGRFAQADRAITERFGGTGLGLAIVRQLCDMMGGSVLLQSEPGRGSSFRCELPLPEVEPSTLPPPEPSPEPPPAAQPLRVLVAEDNATNQVVVRGLLTQAGYQDVTVVEDGLQAVEAAAAAAFDLVLMDCRMPRLDGYEAARRLRAQGFDRPIIALTANAAAGERERCLACGMDDYLSKPIEPLQLAQMLARWSRASEAPPTPQQSAAAPASARERALQQLGGDEELLAVALASFAEQAPRVLQSALEALAAGAAADLRRHLHSLAGSASMVGALEVADLARQLEPVAEAGELATVQQEVDALADRLGRFLADSAHW